MIVAIKTPRSKLLEGREKIVHGLQEIRLRVQLRHQNVLPKFLGITTKFIESLSIVTWWMEGNSHDYVQDESIDPCPLIIGIAQGLQYLHNLTPDAVFHGNLRGLNVLILDNGEPLLTNLGLLWPVDSSPGVSSIRDIRGTVNWMAPEMFDGGHGCRPTAEGDIWAFAMTALELFTRENPFHDHTDPTAIKSSIKKGLPGRPNACNRMTDPWWNILVQCWEVASSSRPTISQVVKSFAALGAVQSPTLKESIKRISRKCPNIKRLDGQIDKDHSILIRGGFATVCRGTLCHKQTKVAVKTARGDLSMDEKIINRILEEVYVWYKLRHANILPLLGITTQFDSTLSIVSRWMERGTARDYVRDSINDPRPLVRGCATCMTQI
ncbi:hypothetical protein SCLCIDRAFT_660544 [Scleroderma citrinum Foug A]|uniref:Protein kinase domain-containing protein n=1 Tax=Scleroderma citrinum Foug A TaxID=1036808 RepID=A0A0C2ZRK6_9AGAM|nr:hypothetical protein SCLCIDRAFT_660544 [Scleroderma citrinum Foug A]